MLTMLGTVVVVGSTLILTLLCSVLILPPLNDGGGAFTLCRRSAPFAASFRRLRQPFVAQVTALLTAPRVNRPMLMGGHHDLR